MQGYVGLAEFPVLLNNLQKYKIVIFFTHKKSFDTSWQTGTPSLGVYPTKLFSR